MQSREGDKDEDMSSPTDVNLLTAEEMEKEFATSEEENKTMLKVDDLFRNTLPSRLIVREKASCRTIQWMEDLKSNNPEDQTYTMEKMLFSDDTGLKIASFKYPKIDNSPPSATQRLTIEKRISQEARVDLARCMPHVKTMIATQSLDAADILIFDSTQPVPNIECPIHRFQGHTLGGCALSWSPIYRANLLSGSNDKNIILWDLKSNSENKEITIWESDSPVNDVQWFPLEPTLFGSIHVDSTFAFWDIRYDIPHKRTVAHVMETTAVSFNPTKPHLFVTGCRDETIGIWDLRNVTTKVHGMNAKVGEVKKIEWLPYETSIFSITGSNGNTQIFDLSKTGMESYCWDQDVITRDSLFLNKSSGEPIFDLACHPHNRGLIGTAAGSIVSARKIPSAIWENKNNSIEGTVHAGIQALLNISDEAFDLNELINIVKP